MSVLNVGNGVNLYYTVMGEGIPIVFIHPPVLTSENFYYQIEELSKQFKVITFDIRGHGKSDYSIEEITYPLIVKDIICLLNHLKISKAFICGYSTGGSIVLEFLLNHPNRAFGGIVISGMPNVVDRHLIKKISVGIQLSKAGAISILACSISWTNSNTTELFKKLFTAARKGNAKNIEQYYRYSMEYDCTDDLGKIDLPILLTYGGKDKPFIEYANLLHDKLPNNKLIFIEDVKHQLPAKAAGELNRLIKEFIDKNSDEK